MVFGRLNEKLRILLSRHHRDIVANQLCTLDPFPSPDGRVFSACCRRRSSCRRSCPSCPSARAAAAAVAAAAAAPYSYPAPSRSTTASPRPPPTTENPASSSATFLSNSNLRKIAFSRASCRPKSRAHLFARAGGRTGSW